MGSLAREWANGPIFFLWKQFFGPGLRTAWCVEEHCASGPWAQIFFCWADFTWRTVKVFLFCFPSFKYAK
jgi:hypothetical protein